MHLLEGQGWGNAMVRGLSGWGRGGRAAPRSCPLLFPPPSTAAPWGWVGGGLGRLEGHGSNRGIRETALYSTRSRGSLSFCSVRRVNKHVSQHLSPLLQPHLLLR